MPPLLELLAIVAACSAGLFGFCVLAALFDREDEPVREKTVIRPGDHVNLPEGGSLTVRGMTADGLRLTYRLGRLRYVITVPPDEYLGELERARRAEWPTEPELGGES